MMQLTEGALDRIMNGEDVEKPILQLLGHKAVSSSNAGPRFRLLMSDGVRVNSFTMLATQLNPMILNNELSEFSICRVERYAISTVNSEKQKRIMVILAIDVLKPGSEVGGKIGNPSQHENQQEQEADKGPSARPPQPSSTVSNARKNRVEESSSNGISTTPIAALSPYQNRWVIKVRVTSKSDIRVWSNSRGEGKLFSMDLVDESGEIRCTAFRDQCDKFFDMIEIGKIYYVSRCSLKPANKQFNTLKNDYEMTLTGESEIIPCQEDNSEIPTIQFDFCPISSVEQKEKNAVMDVLGICTSTSDVQNLTARSTGRELKKRDINLIDQSNTMISLTLWGTQAETFDGSNNVVVAVKGARIGEFNGDKNLSTLNSSVIQIDPDIPEAHRLRGWYNSTGHKMEAKSLSKTGAGGGLSGQWLTFKEAKDLRIGQDEAPGFFVVKATVNLFKLENVLYKSCPTEGCKKKLVDQNSGMYRCEKCNREYPNYKYRLLVVSNLVDFTGHQWVTAFNEEGEKLIGVSAQELGNLKESDNDAFMEKFGEASFNSFIFKLRTKLETFNDEARLKTTVASVTPLDHKVYNDYLLTKLKEYTNISKAK
ncbi:replication protein A 70 kDa DNA-binding subunit [Orussus abietinus]|uniref:replication protein A 70 kDa DNA-binding subunit n=1 Tax=Orussus abietinus TaxID=222816 RepID=UPI000624F77E|nr:replication protein A 70 kDa DNA-binding subunit [Orussus abietinus]XP_012275094.1 replication protein A 70 kDa DNA-binding subunit [Orussus abietinus]